MRGAGTTLRSLAVIGLTMLSCGRAASGGMPTMAVAESSAVVPPEFEELYSELSAHLEAASRAVDSRWDGTTNPVHYATELLAANGNRGEELLSPTALDGNALLLDRLKSMGIDAVKVTITYPLLSPDYPRSAEYLDFYRKVVEAAHQRDMLVLVGIGIIFTEPEISTAPVDYRGHTLEEFKASRKAYAELIINEIGPDYLTLMNEPGTAIHIIPGLAELNQPAKYGEVLEFITRGLDRKGVLIGAGAGTWESPEFIRQVAASEVDYLDLHVYPLQRGFFDRIVEFIDIAKRGGKRVVIGETWLYKIADRELGRAGVVSVEMFGRDAFSFWSPLDIQHIDVMSRLARQADVELISFFWGAKHFFAYLDYEQYRDASPGTLLRQSSLEAARNIAEGQLTATGMAYAAIAK